MKQLIAAVGVALACSSALAQQYPNKKQVGLSLD